MAGLPGDTQRNPPPGPVRLPADNSPANRQEISAARFNAFRYRYGILFIGARLSFYRSTFAPNTLVVRTHWPIGIDRNAHPFTIAARQIAEGSLRLSCYPFPCRVSSKNLSLFSKRSSAAGRVRTTTSLRTA